MGLLTRENPPVPSLPGRCSCRFHVWPASREATTAPPDADDPYVVTTQRARPENEASSGMPQLGSSPAVAQVSPASVVCIRLPLPQ